MEIRKSYKADLEHRRLSGFLLGLIVVLSVFLVLLEYPAQNNGEDTDSSMLNDLSQDLESMPLIIRDKVTRAAAAAQKPSVPEKIRAAENTSAEADIDKTEIISNDDNGSETANGNAAGTAEADNDKETADKESADDSFADDNTLKFRVIETLPEFPGGIDGFMKWLTQMLHYPPLAQRQRIQGTVLVAFIINADGSVTNLKIVKSAGKELDDEALRVMRMMPAWKAGEDHGKPCRTYLRIPIVFKL